VRASQLGLQELVALLQFRERLVVTLALRQLVQVVQLARQVLLQLVLQLVQVQLLVQLAEQQVLLVVAPLELVEHLCLVQQNSQENLAYLF
jgi:hypothetical protein